MGHFMWDTICKTFSMRQDEWDILKETSWVRHFDWGILIETFWVRHFKWDIFYETICRTHFVWDIFMRHVVWDNLHHTFLRDILNETFFETICITHFLWDILKMILWVRHFVWDILNESWFRTKLLVTSEILVLLYSSLCDFSEFQCKNCCKTHKTVSGGKGVTNQCLFFLSVAHLFQSWKKQKKER